MSLTYQPFAEAKPIESLREDLAMNVPDGERVLSGLIGAAFLGLAVNQTGGTRWLSCLVGAALLHRSWSGHCKAYEVLDLDRRHDVRGVPGNRGIRVEESVTIRCPASALYGFWRDLEQLPKVMRHVDSVKATSAKRSHWKVCGPAGHELEWDAEIINDEEDRLIAWQSLPGATVRNAGSVRFEPDGTGFTRVKVVFEFDPPAGVLGARIAELLGRSPQEDLAADLAQFKTFAEQALAAEAHSQPPVF
jgi:uncharacterized membrane protein